MLYFKKHMSIIISFCVASVSTLFAYFVVNSSLDWNILNKGLILGVSLPMSFIIVFAIGMASWKIMNNGK